jgi:hypothetical protein
VCCPERQVDASRHARNHERERQIWCRFAAPVPQPEQQFQTCPGKQAGLDELLSGMSRAGHRGLLADRMTR